MANYRFSTGTQFYMNGGLYEVIRFVAEDMQMVWVEDVLSGREIEWPIMELVNALFKGDLTFVAQPRVNRKKETSSIPNPEEQKIDLSDYSEHLIKKARFRLFVITPLLLIDPYERTKTMVEARVNKVSNIVHNPNNFAVSMRSIYRWMKDYENSGGDMRSLIPNHARSGGAGQSRLEIDLLNLVDAIIKEFVLKREKCTIDDVLAICATRIEEENRFRAKNEKLSLPSRTTIARRINALDLKDRLEARNGKRKARKMLQQAGQIKYPELPLERVEVDHTKTDLIVIDETDNLPLGRLTLSYILDCPTRYPLGYYLGFEPPSYYAVLECLYNSILPKPNTKELYGTEHDWIACGIPKTLVTDQGKEFIGKDLVDACESLGIALDKAPIRTPEFKASVERGFGTINTGLFHKLPGSTFSNFIERGDYNSVHEACISMQELERTLNLFIVDVYAEKHHRGLNGIPARRWEYALKTNFFPRLPPDKDTLRIMLGRVDHRVIQPYGIEFHKIRYNSSDLGFLRNRLAGQQIKIKYHPGDLSRVHIFDPFEKAYLEIPALDQDYTRGLSLWKHKVVLSFARKNGDEVDLPALGRAILKIQNIVEAARDRSRKTSTRSKIARWDRSGKPKSLLEQNAVDPKALPSQEEAPAANPQPVSQPTNFDIPSLDMTDDGWEVVEKKSKK